MDSAAATPSTEPASGRVRLRRGSGRGHYDLATVHAVLDAGLVAHLGVTTVDGPLVIPMAYGRDDEQVYVHGALANAAIAAAAGSEVCLTVTIVDGLIFGRSAFHNSMQYRSVVVRGIARAVDDPAEQRRALQLISDHVAASWDTARPATDSEVRRTAVIAIPLTESSAKIRDGGPADEPEDLDGPVWAGHIPIESRYGEPVDSADLVPGRASLADRAQIAALAGRPVGARP